MRFFASNHLSFQFTHDVESHWHNCDFLSSEIPLIRFTQVRHAVRQTSENAWSASPDKSVDTKILIHVN